MFTPPRCPNEKCPQHRDPQPKFFLRAGSYKPRCRPYRIPRFVCRTCQRGFSRQTFRADYYDHKPHLNASLFTLISSGIGLRQSARVLGLSRSCTELKFRKIGRHLRFLNLNLRRPLNAPVTLLFDEFETFEGRRNTRPISMPVLIERRSYFIVWSECASIRPRGSRNEARRAAIASEAARFGEREDRSRPLSLRTLRRGTVLAERSGLGLLQTDEKSVYPRLATRAFINQGLVHETTNSRVARTTWNPLFPINHTEAIARDLLGRLRRRSWLVSKKRKFLDLAMHCLMAYRNFVRKRFNQDESHVSPAQVLGFVDRRLRVAEILAWRQDWLGRSMVPDALGGGSVSEWKRRA